MTNAAAKAIVLTHDNITLEKEDDSQTFLVDADSNNNSISALEVDATNKNENFKQTTRTELSAMAITVSSVYANQTANHTYANLPKA